MDKNNHSFTINDMIEKLEKKSKHFVSEHRINIMDFHTSHVPKEKLVEQIKEEIKIDMSRHIIKDLKVKEENFLLKSEVVIIDPETYYFLLKFLNLLK